jgi:hypothetical protein
LGQFVEFWRFCGVYCLAGVYDKSEVKFIWQDGWFGFCCLFLSFWGNDEACSEFAEGKQKYCIFGKITYLK